MGIDVDMRLHLHFDGADASTTFKDLSFRHHTVTPYGNAQIDTAQSKFGGASGLFDGNGDYLEVPDADDWDFGYSNFTVDAWIRLSSSPPDFQAIAGQYEDSGNRWYFLTRFGTLAFSVQSGGVSKGWVCGSSGTPLYDGKWHHVAVVRNGTAGPGDIKLYIDGTSLTLSGDEFSYWTRMPDLAAPLQIGRHGSSSFFKGWIDELRVSTIQRWESNFTPPTEPYNQDNTASAACLLSELSVFGHSTITGSSALSLPELSLAAVGLTGEMADGDLALTNPILEGSVWNNISAICNIEAFGCSAQCDNQGRRDGALVFSALNVRSSLIAGTLIHGRTALLPPTIAATGDAGRYAVADLKWRPFDIAGKGYTETFGQGSIALSPMVLDAYATQTVEEAYRSIVINLYNRAISQYEAFGFNSACLFNEKHLGANGDGIHALEGDRDELEDINSEIRTGVVLDPRTPEKKRVPEAYLSVKTDGGFIFGTITDTNRITEYAAQEDGKTAMHNGKVPLGRGVLSNYWGATFRNHEGSDFELQSIELISKAGNRL